MQGHANGLGGPLRQGCQQLAGLAQRQFRTGLEVLGHGRFIVFVQRLVPDHGLLGHFLQGLHALAQGDHHVHRRRASGHIQAQLLQLVDQVRHDRGRLLGLQEVLVDPAQLGHVQARGLGIAVLHIEQVDQFLAAEQFLVTVRPAQPGQVAQQCIRQVAGVLVLHHVGRAGALGQLGALLVQDHRHVAELRHRCADAFVQVDLARGVVDVVVATDDFRDLHVPVVHHHREVVGGVAVRTEDDHVIQLAVGDLDAALDQIIEHHRAFKRVLEADDAVRVVPVRQALLAGSAVVARLFLPGHRGLAHGVQLFPGLVGVVRLAVGDQLLGHFLVPGDALGLVERAFVVVQAQPLHRLQDRIDRALGAAFTVGVLDAQHELAATMAGLQPAVQRGAGATDMQVAGGTGGEAGAAGHGGLEERVSPDFTSPPPPAEKGDGGGQVTIAALPGERRCSGGETRLDPLRAFFRARACAGTAARAWRRGRRRRRRWRRPASGLPVRRGPRCPGGCGGRC